MNAHSFLRTLVILAAAVLIFSACGSNSSKESDSKSGGSKTSGSSDAGGDAAAGKSIFQRSCGGCHTLSDAETTGSAGPKLDGTGLSEDRVLSQIENGGGGMPSGLVDGDDAEAVAAYVASVS